MFWILVGRDITVDVHNLVHFSAATLGVRGCLRILVFLLMHTVIFSVVIDPRIFKPEPKIRY
jgi:hypothetical protein